MFFLGVLGWTPHLVMQEATLEDLADAYEGYARAHGLFQESSSPPSAVFLQKMMRLFPDKKDQ